MTEDLGERLASEAERMEREKDQPRTYVRVPAPKEPSQVYSVRIPLERLEELRHVARRSGKRPSSLLRDWVLDRLAVELSVALAGVVVSFPDAGGSTQSFRNIIDAPRLAG